MASACLQDQANGSRISRLLVDKGTEAMRKTFDNIHPPATLAAVLATNRTLLLRLKPRVINNLQWDLLYPPSGNPADSKTFDLTLLTVLLRNICGLPTPASGWNTMPPDTDRSTEANIARIKFFRNEVYAHVTTTQVDNVKFANLWQRISKALVDLNIPQSEIDVLKNSPLSPEEEMYVQHLKDWKLREDECKDILDKLGSNVQELKQVAEEIQRDVKETRQDVKETQYDVKETQHEVKETQRDVKETHQDVKETQHDVKETQRNVKETQRDVKETQRDVKETQREVKETQRDVKETQREVKQTHQDVKETHQVVNESQRYVKGLPQIQRDVKETQRDVKEFIANYSKESSRNDQKDQEILQQLAKHNFKGRIASAVKSFHEGTRDWLLKRLDEWFTDQESRVLILTAGPGVGKSVFAGKVCQMYGEMGKLAACHFCKFNDSNLRNPLSMLQSLASQMCDNVKGFKEKLLEQLKRPHVVNTLTDAFRVYLHDPLQDLESKEPMLIVIDGLDESESNGKSELLDLIADEFSVLQEWIKILVTSRPEIPVKEKLKNLNPVEILPEDENNESDLRQYFKFCLPSLRHKKKATSALAKKCQGSFLFAFHIKSELLKRGNLADLTIVEIKSFLPKGIGSVYERYFSRLQNALKCVNKDVDVFKLLEILAVARGPLPLKFITHALGMSPDTRAMRKIINEVNEKISALLFVSDDLVTVFHKSVADWLTSNGYEEHHYTVDKENGNELLWRCCEKEFKEIKKDIFNLKLSNEMKYSLEHGYSHLVACKTKYCQESYAWLQDVSIIHVISAVYPKDGSCLNPIWKEVLRQEHGLNRQLRIKISWNLYESEHDSRYLQSFINRSPENCFSDEDKRIAKYILKKFAWCEKLDASRREKKNCFLAKLFSCSITSFDVSSDKKLVAVGHKDGTISFLELPELKELWRYSTTSSVRCCEFLPQASLLLYGRMDTAIDVGARKEVSFCRGNDETFSSCAFSPSGQRMLTSNGSEIIKLWDIAEQRLLALLRGGCSMDCCSFSQNGLFIIGESLKSISLNSLTIWNAITLQGVDGQNMFPDSTKGTLFFTDYTGSVSVKCDNVSRYKGCLQQSTKHIIILRGGRNFIVYGLLYPSPFARGFFSLGDISVTSYQQSNCIFAFDQHSLHIIEPFHFSKVAVSARFVLYTSRFGEKKFLQRYVKALDQHSWLYIDDEKLLGFSIPPHEEKAVSYSSSKSSHVVSCSFSPDGSRLASCTTDGFINILSVHKCQIVQSFCGCGTLAAACWWSEGSLIVLCFIEENLAMLSKYPVDEQLTIKVAQRKDHALDCTVDATLEILAFSDGILIIKLRWNRKIEILDVHEIEDQRWVKLPQIENMECFAVSPGCDSILGVGCKKFRIWKKNDQSPTDYEVWREDEFEAYKQYGLFYNSDLVVNPLCYVNTDGTFGVICLSAISKHSGFDTTFSDDEYYTPYSDRLGVLFFVVNMDSGDITNYFFDKSLGEEQHVDQIDSCKEQHNHFDLFASHTFFAVIRPKSLAVFDIKTCKEIASLSEKLWHEKFDRAFYKGTESALSPDGNVLAIPRDNGHVDFVRIHVPE